MRFDMMDVLTTAAVALGAAVAVIVALRFGMALLARRWHPAATLERRARVPFTVLVLMVALNPVVAELRPGDDLPGWSAAALAARILAIVATGWVLTVVTVFLVDLALMRNSDQIERADNRAARRLRTQVLLLRRLVWAVGVVLTIGAVLLSFPGVESFGASVLASAGVISIVAGLAATSVLGNVFAGLQLAFSDAIRMGDAVIVEEEWGLIEEITLTYVVVHLWDERRLVLPSSYFTTTPFQNWTRETPELMGAVELDLDWRADITAMRTELDRVLAETDLWDGRVKVVQVTDAVGGYVRVRALVSAADAGNLFDLRCLVREHLVAWVRENADRGMPRTRTELVEAPRTPMARTTEGSRGLFHGDAAAEERAARMTQEIDLDEVDDLAAEAEPAREPASVRG
ncbi:mechanosensitive ion channel family protein [Nocardioides sambongensis]|uniref:mechanosensitive ion channel family protein n=1 Tax=Nocardioides sambongensis TaxID=2589074 RepID=UPI0018C8AD24|nr:mechanosensitive ion channel domain-containing protein [Nocardioides sambongensis]